MTGSPADEPRLVLRLYLVSGAPNSILARANLAALLADVDPSSYTLEIVDCITEPHRALAEGVFVTPTLVRSEPKPVQTVIGSLSDKRVVAGVLGLDPGSTKASHA